MHTLHGRDKVRAWVPACATGEEAFSIAILLDEAVRRLPHRVQVTVYASDIDERAIAVARSASYPLAIENDVGPARLSQYFTRDGNRYRLVKSLRDTVIFAAHNLLRDPPFSRIDLVSCRNVLIYMERRAQKQVLDTFFYALRPHEGFLFLGTAESADFAQELFRPIDKQRRIYRARPTSAEPVATATSGLLADKDESAGHAFRGQTFFHDATDVHRVDPRLPSQARALDMFGPAVIVMRADGTIVHRSARADTFTESVRHTRVTNLFDIVRRDAEERVRQAAERCIAGKQREDERSVPFVTAAGEIQADLAAAVSRFRVPAAARVGDLRLRLARRRDGYAARVDRRGHAGLAETGARRKRRTAAHVDRSSAVLERAVASLQRGTSGDERGTAFGD